jgi:hypothetical protein
MLNLSRETCRTLYEEVFQATSNWLYEKEKDWFQSVFIMFFFVSLYREVEAFLMRRPVYGNVLCKKMLFWGTILLRPNGLRRII